MGGKYSNCIGRSSAITRNKTSEALTEAPSVYAVVSALLSSAWLWEPDLNISYRQDNGLSKYPMC